MPNTSFVTFRAAWQFYMQGWYGRDGYQNPFHRKRKASIALSFLFQPLARDHRGIGNGGLLDS